MSTANHLKKKRPFGATIRTLSDITNSNSDATATTDITTGTGTALYSSNDSENGLPFGSIDQSSSFNTTNTTNNNDNNTAKEIITIQHIPTLPNAQAASAMLSRIHSEFHKLIQRRGWNVISITEMCCCGDGIDRVVPHTTFHNNKSNNNNKKKNNSKQRTTKLMPNNVLGYNLTSTTKSNYYSRSSSNHQTNAIHLRLRHPKTHALFSYQDVAGTMCHELAHCEVGPHNAKFYKAMEEIEGQYAVFLTRGVVVDNDGFPMGDVGRVVGGVGIEGGARGNGRGATKQSVAAAAAASNNNKSLEEARRKALLAAESRRNTHYGLTNSSTHNTQQQQQPYNNNNNQGYYILGGNSKSMDSKEAARIAAERRLLDSQYCLPCEEVIEILGEDSSEEEEEEYENHDNDYDDDDDVEIIPMSVATAVGRMIEEEKKEDEDEVDAIEIIDADFVEEKKKSIVEVKSRNRHGAAGDESFACANNLPLASKSAPVGKKRHQQTIHKNASAHDNILGTGATTSEGVIDLTEGHTDESGDGSALPLHHASSSWECSCCTLINTKLLQCCQACDTPYSSQLPNDSKSASKKHSSFATLTSASAAATSYHHYPNIHNTSNLNAHPTQPLKTPSSPPNQEWTCPQCTFRNPSLILVCDVCHSERPCDESHHYPEAGHTSVMGATEVNASESKATVGKHHAGSTTGENTKSTTKEQEVEESRRTFGGFNIYGEKKTPSLTMRHLT